MGWSRHLCLPSILSSETDPVENRDLLEPLHDPGSFSLVSETFANFHPSSRTTHAMKSTCSASCLVVSQRSGVASLVLWKDNVLCKAIFQQLAEFLLYLWKELKISVLAVKGYRSTISHIFPLSRMNIAANIVISQIIGNFERSCPPREIKPPDWSVSGCKEFNLPIL